MIFLFPEPKQYVIVVMGLECFHINAITKIGRDVCQTLLCLYILGDDFRPTIN